VNNQRPIILLHEAADHSIEAVREARYSGLFTGWIEDNVVNTRLVSLERGPDIAFDHPMLVLGRDPRCDARLESPLVSRKHCCLVLSERDVIVRDLGSLNGIRINGRKVTSGILQPGDELSIGDLRYRLDLSNGIEGL
jgi:predicted component of type VI protein secretion system